MRVPTTGFTLALLLAACGATTDAGEASAQETAAQAPITGARPFATKPFVEQAVAMFDEPWAMTVLPGGGLLVTEKAGRMKLVPRDAAGTASVVLPRACRRSTARGRAG